MTSASVTYSTRKKAKIFYTCSCLDGVLATRPHGRPFRLSYFGCEACSPQGRCTSLTALSFRLCSVLATRPLYLTYGSLASTVRHTSRGAARCCAYGILSHSKPIHVTVDHVEKLSAHFWKYSSLVTLFLYMDISSRRFSYGGFFSHGISHRLAASS